MLQCGETTLGVYDPISKKEDFLQPIQLKSLKKKMKENRGILKSFFLSLIDPPYHLIK